MIFKGKVLSSLLNVMAVSLLLVSCSDKKNPISAFEPEIINTADAFQFQITDASDVSTTVAYSWNNSVPAATINHSTSTVSGSAIITVYDADSSQVYSNALLSSGVENTASGTEGLWTIVVVFSNYSGSANFRLEKLTP